MADQVQYYTLTGRPTRYCYVYEDGQRCMKGDVVTLAENKYDPSYIKNKFLTNRSNGTTVENPGVWINSVNGLDILVCMSELTLLRRIKTDEDEHDFNFDLIGPFNETVQLAQNAGGAGEELEALNVLLQQLNITDTAKDEIRFIVRSKRRDP